jgi:hypothetical protein
MPRLLAGTASFLFAAFFTRPKAGARLRREDEAVLIAGAAPRSLFGADQAPGRPPPAGRLASFQTRRHREIRSLGRLLTIFRCGNFAKNQVNFHS